ncbi:DUF421 domain-containing protein [Virgibacillus kimchii]
MLEFLKEMLMILGRIATIIPLLLFMTLFMGKRAIGEMPVFDFLIIVILGALVGADIADPEVKHLPTAIAIIAIAIFQRIVANWKISNRKIGRLLTFEPTVVIHNGKLLDANLKKIRYSIDNILQMLREKDIFDIQEVETALVEPSGTLSVLKKPEKHTVTAEDMNITRTNAAISLPVILEGEVDSDVLKEMKVNQSWLDQQLSEQGITDTEQVFLATLNRDLVLHVSKKDESNITIPPVKH